MKLFEISLNVSRFPQREIRTGSHCNMHLRVLNYHLRPTDDDL